MITCQQAYQIITGAMREVGEPINGVVIIGDPLEPFESDEHCIQISMSEPETTLRAFYKAWMLIGQTVEVVPSKCVDCFVALRFDCEHVGALA